MFGWRKTKRQDTHHADFPKMGSTGYQEVISALETTLGAEWYLEIGSRSGASLAYRKCNYIAIDPEFQITANVFNASKTMMFCQQTSDEFFADGLLDRMQIKPDLAFIDGMHLFEYALRDFINLERSMGPAGVICIHDVCPFNYEMTTRDLSYLATGKAWTGDVWKVIMVLLDERPDLDINMLDARKTGLAVIRGLDPSNTTLSDRLAEILERYRDVSLDELTAQGFYSRFALQDSAGFIARLRRQSP